jgi:hypothetical protein
MVEHQIVKGDDVLLVAFEGTHARGSPVAGGTGVILVSEFLI